MFLGLPLHHFPLQTVKTAGEDDIALGETEDVPPVLPPQPGILLQLLVLGLHHLVQAGARLGALVGE